MLIDFNDALTVLRTEENEGNIVIINGLLDAIPGYISTTTGIKDPTTAAEFYPLIKTLAKFLLCLWFNPDGTDATQLQTVIDNLLKTLKAEAETINASVDG